MRQTQKSLNSSNFPARGDFPLIREDYVSHIHGLAFYVKENLPFAQDLSLENFEDSYLCFWLALLHRIFYFLFLYLSLSSSLATVFDAVLSNIDEALLIDPSANAFVFGDFNFHHKDSSTFSGGTDTIGELCCNACNCFYYNAIIHFIIFIIFKAAVISNNIIQMVNFPTWVPVCDSLGPALLDLIIYFDPTVCSAVPTVCSTVAGKFWSCCLIISLNLDICKLRASTSFSFF